MAEGWQASWHTGGSLLHCLDEAAHSKEPRSGGLRVLIFESLAANGKGLRVRGRVEQGPLWPMAFI